MPTLKFINMGSTPNSEAVSVTGNLYLLMTDDPTTALIFDLRKYVVNPPDDRYTIKFKRIGDFEIPILPPSRLKVGRRPPEPASRWELGTVRQVFVVNLVGESPAKVGWQHLRRLFPTAVISNVPLGRTDWHPVAGDEIEQRTLRSIEQTRLFERGEKVEVGPFMLFLFRIKGGEGLAGILATGETNGRAFSFFLGDAARSEFFPTDRVDAEMIGVHLISAGRWYAFYPCRSENFEPIPVEELTFELA